MIKKTNKPNLDQHLFRQEMGDVVPLKTVSTIESGVPRKRFRVRTLDAEVPCSDKTSLDSNENRFHVDSEDGSSHRKNGVQKRMMQKLKRGHFSVSAQLDLHNMTTKAGHEALMTFIHHSMGNTIECVRVIHGKGLRSEHGPRLKIMTRQLLREHPHVLAFTACKPAEGGEGATDILLKSL